MSLDDEIRKLRDESKRADANRDAIIARLKRAEGQAGINGQVAELREQCAKLREALSAIQAMVVLQDQELRALREELRGRG